MSAHPDDVLTPDYVEGDDEVLEAEDVAGDDEQDEGEWRELVELTEGEIQAALEMEIRDAIGHFKTDLETEQRDGLDLYLSKPWNHQKGQSTVQMDDVRNRIEWAMPSLVRMYLGGHQVVNLEPQGGQDDQAARDASVDMNLRFVHEMDGFTVLHDWFKAALIEKCGQVIVRRSVQVEAWVEEKKGMLAEELPVLLAGGGAKLVAKPTNVREQVVPVDGRLVPITTLDVRLRFERKKTRVKFEGIPNEEFLIARRERALDDDTRFVGWRRRMSLSDLIDQGIDPERAKALPQGERTPAEELELSRRELEAESIDRSENRPDWASREVWVTECWILLDQDGDGHAERRHIICVGDTSPEILVNEYAPDGIPIADLTPIRIPYKRVGLSFADLLKQIERIRTTLVRQKLDNLYRTNHSKWIVREGMVNMESLLDPEPGGYVLCDGPPGDCAQPFNPPSLGSAIDETLGMTEGWLDDRGGSSKMIQGLDASALNESTATGMMAMFAAAGARLELIARVFEPGVTRAFTILFRVLRTTPGQARQRMIRGVWQEIDPAKWNPEWAVRLQVGLGQGRMQERVQQLEKILGIQKAARDLGTGLVDREQMHHAFDQMTGAMGFPSSVPFMKDPANTPPPPPPGPTNEELLKQAEIDLKRAALSLDHAKHLETQRDHNLEASVKQREIAAQIDMERMRTESQREIAEMQVAAQAEQQAAELEIKRLEIQKAKVDVKKAEVAAKAAANKPKPAGGAARKKAARKATPKKKGAKR